MHLKIGKERCVKRKVHLLKWAIILFSRLQQLVSNFPGICLEARGRGLLISVEFFNDEAGHEVAGGLFENNILEAGTLINAKTVRIEPPLTIPRRSLT